MKNRFQIHHLPIFISALLITVFAIVLHCFAPGDSLLDYALTLEDGQFICETGYIYEAKVDFDDGIVSADRAAKVHNKFKSRFGKTPASELLPHEFAMQLTDFGSIFIDNQGQTWRYTHRKYNSKYDESRAFLEPFITPVSDADTKDACKLQIDKSSWKLSGALTSGSEDLINFMSITIPYSLDLPVKQVRYLRSAETEFSVKLRDGWYALPAVNTTTHSVNIPRLGYKAYADAQFRLTVFSDAADGALAHGEFDLIINKQRIHITQ